MDCSHKISHVSGLQANSARSEILFGVYDTEKQNILAQVGMKEGKLPVRYLGVPLTSKKCEPVDSFNRE